MSILSTLDDFDFKDNQSMLAAFEKDVKHITADVRTRASCVRRRGSLTFLLSLISVNTE